MFAKNEPYPKPSEGSSPVVAKDSLRAVWMNPEFLEQPSNQMDGFRPQRADAFLTALAMKQYAGRWLQTQVGSLEIDDLTDSGSRVKQQAYQCKVAAPVGRRAIDGFQNGLDFGQFQMMDFPNRHALERNA